MIKVDDDDNSLLYITRKVIKGIIIKIKDKNNIIINSKVFFNKRFDLNSQSESDFNDDINSDEDENDENI
jgi:hypothetical protein